MMHVPLPTKVTVAPETVHTVVLPEVKTTGRPELAVAATANGAAPIVFAGRLAKAMVCAVMAPTCGAALHNANNMQNLLRSPG